MNKGNVRVLCANIMQIINLMSLRTNDTEKKQQTTPWKNVFNQNKAKSHPVPEESYQIYNYRETLKSSILLISGRNTNNRRNCNLTLSACFPM